MLTAFLKDNKISLSKLTEANPPLSPNSINPSCHLLWRDQPQNKMELVRSPPQKRRKIFEPIETQHSSLTAEFGIPSYSAVSPYQMPKFESPAGQCKVSKRKPKTSKENGLCLVKINNFDVGRPITRPDENNCEKDSNDHLEQYKKGESERQKRVQELQNYNNELIKSIQNELLTSQSESLIINQPHDDTFTFQTTSQQSSLRYSPSKYWSSISKNSPKDLQSPLQITS